MEAYVKLVLFLVAMSCLYKCVTSRASIHRLDPNGSDPDEYLVVFKQGAATRRGAASTLASVPAVRMRREYHIGERMLALVQADKEALEHLTVDPNIELIESNQRFLRSKPLDFRPLPAESRKIKNASPRTTWDDGKFCYVDEIGPYGWGVVRTSYRNLPDYSSAPYMFGDADSGEGVDIYIVDSGIFLEHDDFEGRAVWGMTGDALAATEPDHLDLNGHGTHVAGTSAGKRFGIAKKANLIAIKVLNADGSGYWSDTVQGLEYVVQKHTEKKNAAKKNARSVVNMSLGGSAESYSYVTEIAMQEATEAGVHFAVAAGNSYDDACLYTPARTSVAITVGATNLNDSLASFSNFGPCVNVLAPGRHIASAYIGGTQRYAILSGTSMAAPHVAGVLARYLSQLSDAENDVATPAMVKAQLTDMASSQKILLKGGGESATPNKLLFKTCAGSKHTTNGTTTTTTRPTTTTTKSTSPITTTTTTEPTSKSTTTTTATTKYTTPTTSTTITEPTTTTTTTSTSLKQTYGSLDNLAPMIIGTLAVSCCITALNVLVIIGLLCSARALKNT